MDLHNFEGMLGVLTCTALAHFLYWGRNRCWWARKIVDWVTRSSPDELLGIALLGDLLVGLWILALLISNKFGGLLGVLTWAAVAHFLYWGRNRWWWVRKTVDWMTRSSQDESVLLGMAFLGDFVVLGMILTFLISR